MKQIIQLIFCFSMSIWVTGPNAQVSFTQKLDSLHMLIGDQRNLILTCSDNILGEEPFAILDTLSWFHIVDKGKWTTKDQGVERKIVFTVFDSGYFSIPPLGLFPAKDSVYALGNQLHIEVNYPSDSLNILRPIKSIEETESKFRYMYLIIIGLIFIAGMLFVLYQFFKADRVKPAVIQLAREKKIWETCLQSLDELESKKLWQNQKVKEYYDELNLILRTYLSSGLKIHALENTSSEIIDFIQKEKPEINNWELLRDCFKESDLAKFANVLPSAERNEKWLTFSKEFILTNKELSELILEETRVHWQALIGESMAAQFENPFETVPDELIQLYKNKNAGQLELLHHIIGRIQFQLPEDWIKWHEMHTGIFYRWQLTILNISKNKVAVVAIFLFILPFITLFLPFIAMISIWKKQDIFSRGIFGLSGNNKLVLRNRK